MHVLHHQIEAETNPSASSDSKRRMEEEEEEEEGVRKNKLGRNEEDSTEDWQGSAKHV